MGIHFGISQIVAYAALYFLVTKNDGNISAYYNQAIMLTGLTGLIALVFACFFYRRDWQRRYRTGMLSALPKAGAAAACRSVSVRRAASRTHSKSGTRLLAGECALLLALGAALAEYLNIAVGLLTLGSDAAQEYNDSMTVLTDGKSFWFLALWMGIAAPVAEEAIFRWLIYLRLRDFAGPFLSAALSGAVFGVYHGNLIQGIYAGVLGFVFALILEWSGSLASSALLHIGANLFSLALDEWGAVLTNGRGALIFGYVSVLLFLLIFFGFSWFFKKYAAAGKKRRI